MKDMMLPKKAALTALVKAMKGLDLEKVKGYTKSDDDTPAMEATEVKGKEADKLKKSMKKHHEEYEEEEED
jgi:hypothetical protein